MAVDMAVVSTAFAVANAMGANPKVMLSLFEAALVESGFRNLPYGDRDSVGYLQQRPSQGWPDPMNVETATRSYVNKAKKNDAQNPRYTAGQLAQSVQVSAYPHRYDEREDEARRLLATVQGGGGPAAPQQGLRPINPGGGGDDDGGGLVDAVMAGADALKTIATGAVNIGGLAATVAKLALPSTIVRAIAGGLGVVFIFIGIVILGKQVK